MLLYSDVYMLINTLYIEDKWKISNFIYIPKNSTLLPREGVKQDKPFAMASFD